MRKIIILSLLTGLFAGELEVEGNLTVTEGVNASSFAGDGSGLTNLPSLGDMKPSRIYSYSGSNGEYKDLTVTSGNFWVVSSSFPYSGGQVVIHADGGAKGQLAIAGGYSTAATSFIALENYSFQIYFTGNSIITILEYPISGSGTDQGMDYVEP